MRDSIKSEGKIKAIIEHRGKPVEIYCFNNIVLNKGHRSLSEVLTKSVEKPVYVKNMLFGDGGLDQNEKKKTVPFDRNALFGITRANKPVVAQIDPENEAQSIFTATIDYADANGFHINEMALQLSNENLFSMSTFAGFLKDDQMKITWEWRVQFI